MRSFSRRALNSAVGALFGNISVSISVRAVAVHFLVLEGTAQLRVLGKKVVVENTSLLTLVA